MATTTRERREARADKLREWAGKREEKQEGLSQAARMDEAATGIPFGQPVLRGHHSQRRHERAIERGQNAMRASVENYRKAESMASRAAEIERQLKMSIFDDDVDAIEKLAERIAMREEKRDAMKARNAAYRAENKEALKAMGAYERGQAIPFPSYCLTNIGATIRTDKERMAKLQRRAANTGTTAKPDRMIFARFASDCAECGAGIEQGQRIRYSRTAGARCECCEVSS